MVDIDKKSKKWYFFYGSLQKGGRAMAKPSPEQLAAFKRLGIEIPEGMTKDHCKKIFDFFNKKGREFFYDQVQIFRNAWYRYVGKEFVCTSWRLGKPYAPVMVRVLYILPKTENELAEQRATQLERMRKGMEYRRTLSPFKAIVERISDGKKEAVSFYHLIKPIEQ